MARLIEVVTTLAASTVQMTAATGDMRLGMEALRDGVLDGMTGVERTLLRHDQTSVANTDRIVSQLEAFAVEMRAALAGINANIQAVAQVDRANVKRLEELYERINTLLNEIVELRDDYLEAAEELDAEL